MVNSAGVYEFLPIEEVTEAHFHRQFDLNVPGLILTAKEGEALRRPGRQHRQYQLGR